MVKPICSLINRTLPSANKKLAPPGCMPQYWSPWARPEGELGPCPSPVCESTSAPPPSGSRPASAWSATRGTAAFVTAPVQLARDRFWLRSPAANVWLVPSVIWAIVTE